MADNTNERLYKDLTHLHSYYVYWNVDLLPAVNMRYRLSALEILLFSDMAMNYDSNKQKECRYSYEDLAKKYLCTKNGVKKAVDMLLKYQLIKRVNDRKGSAKYAYVPNVKQLRELLREYIAK